MPRQERLKVHGGTGVIYKLCSGPLHDKPVWLVRNTSFHTTGRRHVDGSPGYRAQCKKCENFNRWVWRRNTGKAKNTTRIVVTPYRHLFLKLHREIGYRRASELLGISVTSWYNILNGHYSTVDREAMRLVITALAENRRESQKAA